MKTILRLIEGTDKGYHELGVKKAIPQKGDSVVFKEMQYYVSYLEFDYDTDTVCVCCL